MPGVPSLIGPKFRAAWILVPISRGKRFVFLVLAERRDQQPDHRSDHAATISDSVFALFQATNKNCQPYRSRFHVAGLLPASLLRVAVSARGPSTAQSRAASR